jgi:putative transcription factor
MSLNHQDWTQVVIRNPILAAAKAPKECVSKNKGTEERGYLRKLENDLTGNATEEAPPLAKLPKLSVSMRQTLIQARIAKKLSQTDLAKQINTRPQIINELESGKSISDKEKAILQKIQKILGVSLKFEV